MPQTGKCLIAAAIVLLSASYAAAQPAMVGSNLNLRSGPGPAFGVIVMMPAGSKVEIQKCRAEWCRVKYGRQVGYTARDFLKVGADAFASTAAEPEPAAEPVKPRLTGPRIWRWRDAEWRDNHWRRFGWRNRLKRRH